MPGPPDLETTLMNLAGKATDRTISSDSKNCQLQTFKGTLAFEISELWTFCRPGCRFSTPPEKIGALDFSSSKIAGDRDLKIHSGQSPYNSTREDPWEKVWPLKVRRKNMCICHHLVAVAEMKRLETSSRFLAFKKNQSCHVIRPNKP